MDEHGLVLADAVGAVGGLRLHRWIPPGVVEDDGVRLGEIETEAAGLEADQEQIDLAERKRFDDGIAVASCCR